MIAQDDMIHVALSEYLAADDHVLTSAIEAAAMRAAIRGIMVRLGLYEDFTEALDACEKTERKTSC